MKDRSEVTPGVGEATTTGTESTEFLDFVATQGLRTVYLAATELRIVAGAHPTEFPNAAERGQALQRVIAFMEHGLEQAGYADEDINRVPKSAVRPAPSDPNKPRTNL